MSKNPSAPGKGGGGSGGNGGGNSGTKPGADKAVPSSRPPAPPKRPGQARWGPMSNATPMSSARRADIYARLSGADNPMRWTARQRQQWAQMDSREHYRAIGTLPPSGASGERTRRPWRGTR